MKREIWFSILLILTATSALTADGQQEKLKVVTTLNYLKDVVQNIGGDKVEVNALSNPRQDPHYVTPTPRMNKLANEADLFVENGLALDLWAKNVIDASGNPRIQPGNPGHLIATLSVPVREIPTEVSRAWGDIHPQGNPHVWLDPFNVKIIAENIAQRLQRLDAANSEYYQARLQEYKDRLDAATFGNELLKAVGKRAADILTRKARFGELEEWLRSKDLESKLGGWLAEAKKLKYLKVISYHKTYVYFAERFGVNIVGELEEKPGIPPPPKHRDAIVEQMKQEGVRIILNDNFYSTEAAEYIASKTSAKIVITYVDVGASEEVGSYEKLISYLLKEIKREAK